MLVTELVKVYYHVVDNNIIITCFTDITLDSAL